MITNTEIRYQYDNLAPAPLFRSIRLLRKCSLFIIRNLQQLTIIEILFEFPFCHIHRSPDLFCSIQAALLKNMLRISRIAASGQQEPHSTDE